MIASIISLFIFKFYSNVSNFELLLQHVFVWFIFLKKGYFSIYNQ